MITLTRRTLLAGLAVAAVGASAVYATGAGNSSGFELKPDDSKLVSRGGEVYAQYCASCHGATLEGEPDWQSGNPDGTLKAPPHDETGHTWHHADELLFRVTKFGTAKALDLKDFKSNMPAFEDTLSDAEIVAALSWIKARRNPGAARHDERTHAEQQPMTFRLSGTRSRDHGLKGFP